MAETEMVERVARAMYDERLRRAPAAAAQFDLPWDAMSDDEKAPMRFLARAAIQAMRSPTDAMLRTGSDWVSPEDAQSIYIDMIDAALSPPSKD